MVTRVTEDISRACISHPAAATEPASTPSGRPLRFGLVGTGYWARVAHARALADTPGIEFAAVWGRNPEAAATLAGAAGATAHRDFDAFLAEIDAVAFSVPPDVQSELAVRAARAGKHLLLEKPMALSDEASDALVAAVDAAGVASVVFFTSRFQPDARAWLEDVTAAGGWAGGHVLWLGSVYAESSPFNTPWRREKGGLWDLGPHVVSLLWAILGPVDVGHRRHRPRRPHAPRPAPRRRRDEHGHPDAGRTRGSRWLRPAGLGRARPDVGAAARR